MRTAANGLVLAATDLSNFLACPHRSALDFAAALGQMAAPDSLLDAHTRLLRDRGEAHVLPFKSDEAALAAVRAREVHVLGGTAWLWADEVATAAVDILFVDEAGQFSLASTLAVAQAADSVVLLGDPQQLAQPQKATHPDGVEVSALAHVLGEHKTMPPALGIFMPETWRLAPSVCDFTSELFYGSRLHPVQSLANQRVTGTSGLDGAGLWWVPIQHDGNRSASDEEVEVVVNLVEQLTRRSATATSSRIAPTRSRKASSASRSRPARRSRSRASGGHTATAEDWKAFLQFLGKYF